MQEKYKIGYDMKIYPYIAAAFYFDNVLKEPKIISIGRNITFDDKFLLLL
jgi:hypothetical protein